MTDNPRDPVLRVIDTLADRYLRGKIKAVKLAVTSLLAGGHLLLEDIPGLGKTTLALASGQNARPVVRPHPVHQRPAPLGYHRAVDFRP